MSPNQALPIEAEIASSKHRNHRRFAVGLVAVVTAVFFALLLPVPFHGRAATALGDLVHAPLFGSLAFAWLWMWQRIHPMEGKGPDSAIRQGRRLLSRGLTVWIALTLFGLGMEILQSGMGRTASRHDAVANSLGIAAAIAGYTAIWFVNHGRKQVATLFGFVAALILASAWSRPASLLADVVLMPRQFPLLASFESTPELTRWYMRQVKSRLVQRDATDGQFALEVDFLAEDYPAITMVDLVSDWTGHHALEIDVTLDSDHPAPTASLMIRIIDEAHRYDHDGTFRKLVTLTRGRSERIQISLEELSIGRDGSPIDLTEVILVDLAMIAPKSPAKIRFDRLKLGQ